LVNRLKNPGSFWKILRRCEPVYYVNDIILCDEWFQYFNLMGSVKYMGLLFNPQLSWNRANDKLKPEAIKAIYDVRNYHKPCGYYIHDK